MKDCVSIEKFTPLKDKRAIHIKDDTYNGNYSILVENR